MSGRLRVEESAPTPAAPAPAPDEADVDYWRRLAISSGERLQHAETQLKDLRRSTDDMRGRLTKAKERQDSAQARVNELQAQLVMVSAERDDLKRRLGPLEAVREKAWNLLEDAQTRLLEQTT